MKKNSFVAEVTFKGRLKNTSYREILNLRGEVGPLTAS